MNLDDLSCLVLVAGTGSISSAAVSQGCDASTISRRIAQLEKSAGTRLFTRSGRGVELTPQGELLLTYARQVFSLLESAQKAMVSAQQQGPARIRIAAQPTIAKMLFGDLFHAIRARYPSTQIHFTEALADKILAGLQAGNVDIAILYKPQSPGSLAYDALLFEQLYLITPPDYAMTPERLHAEGLAGIPLVLPSTHHGVRVLVQALAARDGYTPQVALESDSSIAITLDLVQKRCGCTVLPLAAAADDIAAGRLRGLPLRGEGFERCVALTLGKTTTATADLWEINAMIRSVAAQLVRTRAWPGTRLAQA